MCLCGINRTGQGLLIWNETVFCYGIPSGPSSSRSPLSESNFQGGNQQGLDYLLNFCPYLRCCTDWCVIFLVIVQKYPYKSSAKGRRTYFGLQFQVTVYPGRRVMEAGAWSGWSYGTHNQDAERGECCWSAPGHLLPTVRVGSLNWEIPW